MQHQEAHSYGSVSVEEHITHFIAGFTAFKQKKVLKNCQECLKSILKPREEASEGDSFTLMKESFGGYSLPTDSLVALIKAIEIAAAECVAKQGFHEDMLFTTMKYINIDSSCFVGCLEHVTETTKRVMRFYLITRMFWAGEMKTMALLHDKEKRKDQRRNSKA